MSKEKDFNDLYKEALEQNNPSFSISTCEPLGYAMLEALKLASPLSLGLTGTEMKALHDKLSANEPLTFYEHACASNNLEGKTAKELGMNMPDYLDMMVKIQKLSAQWNKETEDIRQLVIQQVAKKAMKPGMQKV